MMESFEVTKMSSKGQVVIPQDLRERMHLEEGSKFAVVGTDDTIILKKLEPPKWEDFDKTIDRLRKLGKERGLTEKDVDQSVRNLRGKH